MVQLSMERKILNCQQRSRSIFLTGVPYHKGIWTEEDFGKKNGESEDV
jgi:hypothetical protein